MKILAFQDEQFRVPAIPPFFLAQLNPEGYRFNHRVEYQRQQAAGTSGGPLQFNRIQPEELEFEFLFDTTGATENVLNGNPAGVHAQLELFKRTVLNFDGSIHRPRYLILNWGTLVFKCVARSIDFDFKLFNQLGVPLRASARVGFVHYQSEQERIAKENASSPDLTHVYTVKAGDSLPLLCERIYGDPSYYLEIAQLNGLVNFRQLETGSTLRFPPLAN